MNRIAIFVFVTLLSFSLASGADSLRPMSHEEIWLTKRLGSPVVSPDGRFAVVSVLEPSYEEDGDVSDLWLIDLANGAEPRRITDTKQGESGLAWSPDSTRLAFTTKRGEEEVSQVYVLPMTEPGEAIQITSLSTGASGPVWSPDGSKIAFESRVFPGTTNDEENQAEKKARDERKTNVSAYDIFPIRQWDRWRDDLQTHLFVQEASPGGAARDLLAGTRLVNEAGYSGAPTSSSDTLSAAWSPDGRFLVFNATENLHDAAHSRVHFQLYRVPLEGGEPEKLTSRPDLNCTGPKFAPTGDALYCHIQSVNLEVYNLPRIGRMEWKGNRPGGDIVDVTAGLDRPAGDPEFSTDGSTLYLTAADAGRVRIYALPATGGDARMLDPLSRGVYAGLQVAGDRLIAHWESSAVAAEIVSVETESGRHEEITRFNRDRSESQDRPAFREFWFESSKGRRIHNWIALPPAFDPARKYPLVAFIHGGPFSSSMDSNHVRWSAHLLASPGYVVILTDFTGSVGYGEQFSRNIHHDPLRTPGEEIIEAMQAAAERFPFIDDSRQAATGASYGGHLVNWLQATTTHLKALVGHAGLVDLEGQYSSSDGIFHREIMNGGPAFGGSPVWKEQSPSTYAGHFQTPILLTIGEKDYRVPINQTISAWSYVQRARVPGRLLVFHDANHWIMKGPEASYFWDEVHAWLAKYLQP